MTARPLTNVAIRVIPGAEAAALARAKAALLVDLRFGDPEARLVPGALPLPAFELREGQSGTCDKLVTTLRKIPAIFFDVTVDAAMKAVQSAGLTSGRLYVTGTDELFAALDAK